MSQDIPNTPQPPFQSSSQTLPPPQWQQPPSQPLSYSPYPQQQQWEPPAQPYPPQYQPQMPPQQENSQQQPQYGSPPPPEPPKKAHKLLRNKWFWIAVVIFIVIGGTVSALSGGNSSTAPTSDTAQPAATQPAQPATTAPANPTQAPEPTQVPTLTPAQIEKAYKAITTSTTVANLDKDGNNDLGKDVHFTATILNFVKDDSGNTAGANVTDPNTSGVIQVGFPSGTDLSQLNTGDTLEVWGTDGGTSSGTNAFGATIQEVGVSASYMTDQTTGYHAG